jgi:hypothetical protein
MHVILELWEPDTDKWFQFHRQFTHFVRGGIDILDKVFCGVDTWFHLSGYVDSQNRRMWSDVNLCIFHERPLLRKR